MDKNEETQINITMKAGGNYKKYIFPSLLVFFLLLLVFSNYSYLSIEGDNLAEHLNDEIVHLVKSQYYHIAYTNGDWIRLIFQDRLMSTFPPLVYLDTLIFYILFGKSKITAISSFLFFYLIIIFSTYFTGSLLFSRDVGFLAGLAVLSPPLVALSTHLYILDFPLAAMISLSIFLLFKSGYFREKLWTILFFISLGLALLTKTSAVQYLSAPFAAVFAFFAYDQLKDRKTRTKFILVIFSLLIIFASSLYLSNSQPFRDAIQRAVRSGQGGFILFYALFIGVFIAGIFLAGKLDLDERVRNFSVGILICMILVWHYYGMHVFEIYESIKMSAFVGHMEEKRSLIESLRQYMDFFQGRFLTFFLIIGLLAFPFLRKTREQKILLFGFLVSTFVIFSTPVTNERYYIPLTVFSAIFACYWIPRIKFSWIRCPLSVVFIAVCFLGCFSWFVGYNYDKIGGKPTRDLTLKYIHPPPHTDKPIFAEMIKIMREDVIPEDTCIVYFKSYGLRSPFRPWVEPIFIDWITSREFDVGIHKYRNIPRKHYENDSLYLQIMPVNIGRSENPSRVMIIYTWPEDFKFKSLEEKLVEYRDKSFAEHNLILPGKSLMKILVIDNKSDSHEIIREFYELEPEDFGGKMRYMK
ncbi:MAG: glycosyltransferase family 39 protein [Candidatus Eremiobacteraeota bacterium]|nr:glycosyltransferase family 39 protein [Candidatus Eremiobacteraeota bacterium]